MAVDNVGTAIPPTPTLGYTWLDTSGNAPVLKVYDGTVFVTATPLGAQATVGGTISIAALGAAMRLGDGSTALSEPINGIVTRLGGVGEALVTLYANSAPLAVKQESIIRLAAYLYDSPDVRSGDRYAAAWRNSGAASLVSPWVERRVSNSDGIEVAGADTPSPPNGGGGLTDAERARLLPPNATDGQIALYQSAGGVWIAADFAPGGTIDLTARAAAAAAQGTANAATTVEQATALIATWARSADPTGHIPATLVGENPVEGTIPQVAVGGRTFRFVEPSTFGGQTVAQVNARIAAGVYNWALTDNTDQIPANKLGNAGEAATDAVAPPGGGQTLTPIGASQPVMSDKTGFTFPAATATAFLAAWESGTYHAFLVAVRSETGASFSYSQFQLFRVPETLEDAKKHVFQLVHASWLTDNVSDVNLTLNRVAAPETLQLGGATSGIFQASAAAQLYGVS